MYNSKKKWCKFIAVVLIMSFILPLLPKVELKATEILYSGKSGDLDWTIDSEGCLTITGKGDYILDGDLGISGKRTPKWSDNSDYITSAVVDVQNITNCERMFYGCENLLEIKFVSFNTSKVTDMSQMFYRCTSLTKLNVSGFDTSQVVNMYGMFDSCNSLESLDVSGFDTAKVKDMSWMFYTCGSLTKLDISKFNTSQVTTMDRMFDGCSNLTTLDVSKFNTSKVTSMFRMFGNCTVEKLDVSAWDTSNVIDMSNLFFACRNLTSIDVGSWDTSNVVNMSGVFSSCDSLTDLDISTWDTSNVTNMAGMFAYCSELQSIDINSLDTSNVASLAGLFRYCKKLVNIDISGIDTSQVTDMSYMFYVCSSLKNVEFGDIDLSKVENMDGMFARCESLESLDMSAWDLSNVEKGRIFQWEAQSVFLPTCENMKYIYSPKNLHSSAKVPLTDRNEAWFDNEGNVYEYLPQNQSESILLQKGIRLDPPVANFRGGNYSEIKTVSLSTSSADAEIYYTIDGSNPSRENGILYTGPITIAEALELRAIAVKTGRPNSSIMYETYSFVVDKEKIDMDSLELGEDKAGKVENDDITQVFPDDYELELALVPVKASCEEQVDGTYKIKVSIGIEREDLLDSETEWLRYKKCVKDLEKNSLSVNGLKTLFQQFDSKSLSLIKTDAFEVLPEVSALGYAEVQIDKNGNIIDSDCKMKMEAKWKGSVVWPFVTPLGPIYIKLAGEAGVSGEGVPALEVLDSNELSLQIKEGQIDIEPEISIEAGYGVDKVATLGAKGSAKLDFQVFPASSAEFSGKAGIHAYVAFVFDEEYHFLTAKTMLWDTTKEKSDSNEKWLNSGLGFTSLKQMDRSYSGSTSSWSGSYAEASRVLDTEMNSENTVAPQSSEMLLQSSVMPNTLPMIQKIGSEDIMIFQSDDPDRDQLNRSVLMYSVYRDGIWSEPEPIWDTGTNDMYADFQIIGDQLCVVWQKINDKVSGSIEDAFSTMEKKSDICFALYNPDTCKFENAQYIINDDQTDMMPKLALDGNNITVVWVRNQDNDFMQRSGKNQIMYKVMENGVFGEEKILWETEQQIDELTAFYKEGVLNSAIVTGSADDTKKKQVCLIDGMEENDISSGTVSDVQYTGGVVYYWKDGFMYEYDLITSETAQIKAGEYNILSNAKIYENENKTAIIWSKSDINAGISDVYSSVKTEEGFSSPVKIYTGTEAIQYLDAVLLEDGEWHLIMNTMKEKDEKEIHSLVFAKNLETPNVGIEMVTVDPVSDGNNSTVTCIITNTSEQVVHTLIFHYEDGNGVIKDIPLSVEIEPGESLYQKITLDLPEVTDTTDAQLTIYAENQADISNNTVLITVKQTDIQLDTTIAETKDEVCVAVIVTNNSEIASDVTVTLYGNTGQTEVLDSVELEGVAKNSGKIVHTFRVSKTDLKSVSNQAAYLPVVATSSKQDLNEENNKEIKVVYDLENTDMKKGDINADGGINLVDLMLCLNHVGNKELLEGDAS